MILDRNMDITLIPKGDTMSCQRHSDQAVFKTLLANRLHQIVETIIQSGYPLWMFPDIAAAIFGESGIHVEFAEMETSAESLDYLILDKRAVLLCHSAHSTISRNKHMGRKWFSLPLSGSIISIFEIVEKAA